MENVTKGGIKKIPTDLYMVSGAEIIEYLEKQVLGFEIGANFKACPSNDPLQRFIIMRVGMHAEDIIVQDTSDSYASRVLAAHGTGAKINEAIIESLKPFMFSPEIRNYGRTKSDQELQRLAALGVTGEVFNEIAQYGGWTYNQDKNQFGIYLDPAKIALDMLKDPSTDAIDGVMDIIAVGGYSSDTMTYYISVTKGHGSARYGIDVESLFK